MTIKIVSVAENFDSLVLEVSPQEVEVGDVLGVGEGYEITGIAQAEHQNRPALRFSLGDTDGREAGRLVLQTTSQRILRVGRRFESLEELEEFRMKVTNGLPMSARPVKARTLEVGESLILQGRSWEIEAVDVRVNRGEVEIVVILEGGIPEVFPHDSLVWVE
jgi:hypothetical protein